MKCSVRCAAEVTMVVVLLCPNLAFGQSDTFCFDRTLTVKQDLGENPGTLPEG